MKLIGLFERPHDREHVTTSRDTWQCKGCGWVNIFQPLATESQASTPSWRNVELKQTG